MIEIFELELFVATADISICMRRRATRQSSACLRRALAYRGKPISVDLYFAIKQSVARTHLVGTRLVEERWTHANHCEASPILSSSENFETTIDLIAETCVANS